MPRPRLLLRRLGLLAMAAAAALLLVVPSRSLDRRIFSARHKGLTVADSGQVVVLPLEPGDLPAINRLTRQGGAQIPRDLRGVALLPFPTDHLRWRAVHGWLLDRLVAAGVRVVAFDLRFAVASPRHSRHLLAALRRARAAGVKVVLGLHGQAISSDLYRAANIGVQTSVADRETGTIKRLLLFDQLDDGTLAPALFLQAYALQALGRPVEVEGGRIRPRFFLPGRHLWVRYSRTALPRLSYGEALERSLPALTARVRGKIAVVGVAWGQEDLRSVPYIPPGQPRQGSGDGVRTHGLYVVAHAVNQLLLGRLLHGADGPTALLLQLLACCLVALPFFLALGLRPWLQASLGLLLLAGASALALGLDYIYPVAGTLGAGLCTLVIFWVQRAVESFRLNRSSAAGHQ